MKYYFAIDANTQWFSKLIATNDLGTLVKMIDVDQSIHGPIISNILDREPHYTNQKFWKDGVGDGKSYTAWTISNFEFLKLEEVCQLYPSVLKYNQLLKI